MQRSAIAGLRRACAVYQQSGRVLAPFGTQSAGVKGSPPSSNEKEGSWRDSIPAEVAHVRDVEPGPDGTALCFASQLFLLTPASLNSLCRPFQKKRPGPRWSSSRTERRGSTVT